jgi:precorrin-8X/cobalt-precorrin-8 methylmutase
MKAAMDWHAEDARALGELDRELSDLDRSPSEYYIVRQVIFETADLEYGSLIQFSENALQSGAAALAARTTIVTDMPMVQVGIAPKLQRTFSNPVYCGIEALTRPQRQKTQAAWGVETLARRYPEAIFVLGQSSSALASLIETIENEDVNPALVIATPSGFMGGDVLKERLNDARVPHIRSAGRKGSAIVAVAIFNALLDLAWQAYAHGENPLDESALDLR